MRYLIFPLLIISLSVSAQDIDPNAEVKTMGLEDRERLILCNLASGNGGNFKDWGLPPIMEMIFLIENRMFPDFATPEAAKKWFAEIWETKYSKCYCDLGPGLRTTLDAVALYYEKDDWVFAIYNSNGPYKANINQIRYISWRLDKKGTLLDYVQFIKNGNLFKVRTDSDYVISLSSFEKKLKEYGAKNMSDMTAE
ncbi:MAG: hypothetical protein RIC80_06875 [Cyclobacteriaceae bacterium]